MKWPEFSKLSIEDRRNRFAEQFKADCHNALEIWNADFPDKKVAPERLTHFLSVAHGFHTVHLLIKDGVPEHLPQGSTPSPRAWARQSYNPLIEFGPSELPATNGECFIHELAMLGGICWGWRSPAPTGEKAKGTLRRGILQMLSDHFASFDSLGLYLYSIELKGRTAIDVARSYANWSGDKTSAESIAGAIHDRIGRIETPRQKSPTRVAS